MPRPPRRHWPPGREGGGEGSPESEDLPPPDNIEPLAEGRIRVPTPVRSRHRLRGARWARRNRRQRLDHGRTSHAGIPRHGHGRERQGHDLAGAAAHRLALGHRDRVAVRDRRRLARWSPSTTSRTTRRAPRRRRSPASRRTSRRSSPTGPISSSRPYDPKGLVDALGRLGIPVLVHNAAATLPGAYQQIRQLGLVTGKRAGAAKVVAGMRARIGKIVASTRGKARGLSVYHELTPDLYSATSNTFIGRAYALLGLRNIADAADRAGTGYPQLSPEYVVSASPDLIVLADSICCGQKASTVAARPGWGTIAAVQDGLDRPHRRLGRLPLGAAARRLLPRRVERGHPPAGVIAAMEAAAAKTRAEAVRPRGLPLGLGGRGGRLPRRLRARRDRGRPGGSRRGGHPPLDGRAASRPGGGVHADPCRGLDPLGAPHPARRARRPRRRDARARGRNVPGRLPEPARRPVPARGRGRRGARGDARDRLPPRRAPRTAGAASGGVPRRARGRRARIRRRSLGRT